jgi:hypothetical protein
MSYDTNKQRCLHKKTMNNQDDAIASSNTLITSLFNRKSLGRRPQRHSLCTDAIFIVAVGRYTKKKKKRVMSLLLRSFKSAFAH